MAIACPFDSPKRSAQRGVATVEFAILIIPLLLLLLGVFEYGRAIYQYNTLAKAVRDGTRLLSAVAPGTNLAVARCLVVHGNEACTGSPLVQGLTTGMVSVCDATSCAGTHAAQATGHGSVNLVTVTVTGFTYNSLFNFSFGGFTFGAPNITYDPISVTMRQAS
jgi:Flp pilus assembly protein TadG